jgi:hypothetical protein
LLEQETKEIQGLLVLPVQQVQPDRPDQLGQPDLPDLKEKMDLPDLLAQLVQMVHPDPKVIQVVLGQQPDLAHLL